MSFIKHRRELLPDLLFRHVEPFKTPLTLTDPFLPAARLPRKRSRARRSSARPRGPRPPRPGAAGARAVRVTVRGLGSAKLANFAKFCKILQNFAIFWRARSRLYQNEILQENMRLTAFFKLDKICILLHRCNLKILAKSSQHFASKIAFSAFFKMIYKILQNFFFFFLQQILQNPVKIL